MYQDIMNAIATHGASWGDMWAEMSQSTILRHGAHSLMDFSGRMIRSLTRFVRPTVAGVSGNATTILHEHGRGRAWRGAPGNSKKQRARRAALVSSGQLSNDLEMPVRDVMGYDDATIDLIVEMCLDYAVGENARIAA